MSLYTKTRHRMSPPTIISVEGCIGAGKTTFLKELEGSGYCVVYEPVDDWTKEKIGEKSLFELYYEDKQKYGFPFQMFVLQSRIEHFLNYVKRTEQEKPGGAVIITERCPLTDHNVFTEMMFEQGIIDRYSYTVYKKWFEFMINTMIPNEYAVSGIVYLRVNPETCVQRILKRNRIGETLIDLNYLNCLQAKHEKWLLGNAPSEIPVMVIDGNGGVPSVESIAQFVRSLCG